MKIILLSDDAIRLEVDEGPMTIEAIEPDQQYSPFHMLASSLAYCTFSVMYSWATHTKQGADDLVIDVSWTFSEDEPKRVAELRLTWDWPSLPAKKQAAAKRVAAMCTIHETQHHPPVDITEPRHSSPAGAEQPDEAEGGAHAPAARA